MITQERGAAPRSIRRGRRWMAFAAVGLGVGAVRVESLADPNVLWETRNGLDIISSGHLPRSDSWSWTVPGRSWVPNSWGWDTLLGAVYRLAGGSGLVALDLLLVTALFIGMAAAAMARNAGTRATLVAVGALGGVILMPWVIVRPQLASYLFVLAVLPVTHRLLSSSRAACLGWLAVIAAGELVWVNLHFVAIVGPVLVAAAGVGRLVGQRRRQTPGDLSIREGAGRLALAVVASTAMCAATPYGAVAASKSLAVRNDAVGLIVEWRPAGFASFSQFTAVLALAAAVVAGAHAARAARWDTVAVLGVLAVGAAGACRMAPLLAVVALPELAAWLSARPAKGAIARTGFAFGCAVLLVGAGIGITQLPAFGKLDRSTNSAGLIDRIPHRCRVVNDYQLGGALIMFRPDVRVSVDSRTDLYRRAGILANRRLLDGHEDDPQQHLAAADVDCVLAPSDSPLVRSLRNDGDQGWHVVGSDGQRTLLVHQ